MKGLCDPTYLQYPEKSSPCRQKAEWQFLEDKKQSCNCDHAIVMEFQFSKMNRVLKMKVVMVS